MARHPLEGFEVMYEVQRLPRESALSFKKDIRESADIDEDYAHFLLLSLDYHKESRNEGGNEGGNEGPAVVSDKLNNDVDEYEDQNEDEDEDEDDPDYKKFLANLTPKGTSYVLKIDRGDGSPVFIEYEKEDGSDEEYEHLGGGIQQDAGHEKDLEKVESKPFSRNVLENDSVIEPLGPVTQKEKGLVNGTLKRRRKGEKKNKSNKEQKTGKGRKSAKKITNKEEAADSLVLECKNRLMTTKVTRKYNLKWKPSLSTILENDSNSDSLSPKKKKIKGLTSKKSNMKGYDASSKRQGKGEKKKRSTNEQTARKARKSSAIVTVNEDVVITVKEEIADVDEASFRSGHSFESKAAEDDLQMIVSDNCTFGKDGSSILMDASSAKHYENVEDICPLQTVTSDFWWNVKAVLEKPYDQKEYIELWKLVKCRKPVLKNSDLRNGKFYSTGRLGKSYLDYHKDLQEKLKEVDNDNRKRLNILRGFFFWLQNLTQEGAFKPWTNPEWLSLVDKSSG